MILFTTIIIRCANLSASYRGIPAAWENMSQIPWGNDVAPASRTTRADRCPLLMAALSNLPKASTPGPQNA